MLLKDISATMIWYHIRYNNEMTRNNGLGSHSFKNGRRSKMASDNINATTTYVMWRE